MSEHILVREGTLEEVLELTHELSEFEQPHPKATYVERMKDKDHLILIATVNNSLAGFKVGYDKFQDGSFYTWMGGVKAKFRRKGIAKMLAKVQEDYARDHGYDSILLKTRNRHKNMLLFALNSGFNITEVLAMEDVNENRILLKKQLN